jgi:hypothetical protein
MKQNQKKNTNRATPEEHIEALGELLTQLKRHLIASAGEKGTYGDYLRLLDFYQNTPEWRPKELIVSWVSPEDFRKEPAA